MKTYIISYDLRAPGRNYASLIAAIKEAPLWCHPLESFWLVKTSMTSAQIRDVLSGHIDSNDRLLVVLSGGEGAWLNLVPEASAWLKNNL